ncbi:MAG: alkaline phosphatase family protein, partial [Bdellovibrionota bacterium]
PGPGSGLSTEKYFPHKADFGTRESMAMPLGVDLTETAAERAFEAFKLGQGAGTDLFAVSFSSHDYVGHQFGPNSREMEEMTVAEDFAISQLLNMVREKVPGGLKNTVVILTGDHGIPPIPETAQAARIEAGRIDDIGLTKQMNGKLNERHGKPAMGEWIGFVHDFNFFLNRKAAAEKKIELAELEAEIKDMLLPVPGVAFVFTGADYAIRKLPPGMHERQAIHTYYPGRSGEVMLIPKPFWIRNEDRDTHLTGYSYDRSVPLAIAGFGIRPGIYANRADVIDIAPTLSFLSGVLAPALSEGRVLSEAVDTGALK